MTEKKRFTIEKEYNSDGTWEYCYCNNKTGQIFNFADECCEKDFLQLVNTIISDLEKENRQLKYENEMLKEENEQSRALIQNRWNEYLKKKEAEEND